MPEKLCPSQVSTCHSLRCSPLSSCLKLYKSRALPARLTGRAWYTAGTQWHLKLFGVAGQEGPVQPDGAWERRGCSGPHSLPGCMGTGPWSWTEGFELGLGRVFLLLGWLPIAPQRRTLRSTSWREIWKRCCDGTEQWLRAWCGTIPPWLCPTNLLADACKLSPSHQDQALDWKGLFKADLFFPIFTVLQPCCSVSGPLDEWCTLSLTGISYFPFRAVLIPPHRRKLSLNSSSPCSSFR